MSLTADDVRQIYGLRAAIEGRAARLLVERRAPSIAAELRSLLEQMEQAVAEDDPAAVFRHDLAFHDGLCRLSGNARLHEVFTRYVPMLRALLRLDERIYPSLADVAREHLPLVEAIERGDAALAATAAEEHCDQAAELIVGYLARQRLDVSS